LDRFVFVSASITLALLGYRVGLSLVSVSEAAERRLALDRRKHRQPGKVVADAKSRSLHHSRAVDAPSSLSATEAP